MVPRARGGQSSEHAESHLQGPLPIVGLHTTPDFPQDLLHTCPYTKCWECKDGEPANLQDRRPPPTCPDESHTLQRYLSILPS